MEKKLQVSDWWKKLAQSKTWAELLKGAGFKWSHRQALVFENESINYAEYYENARKVAKGLICYRD